MTTSSREIAARGTEIVMPHKGGPEVLQTRRREVPRAGAGEAVVRVEAAGIGCDHFCRLSAGSFSGTLYPTASAQPSTT